MSSAFETSPFNERRNAGQLVSIIFRSTAAAAGQEETLTELLSCVGKKQRLGGNSKLESNHFPFLHHGD